MRAPALPLSCLLLLAALAGCRSGNEAAAPAGALTAEELALEAPADAEVWDDIPLEPVAAADAKDVAIRFLSETGYVNARQEHVIDLLERDYAYITAKLTTADGRPVQDAQLLFETTGSTQIVAVSEASARGRSDESGMLDFGLVGGSMGLDRVTVRFGEEASADILVNVISLAAAGYPSLDDVEGALRWNELLKAQLSFVGDTVEAEFPESVQGHDGKSVKLVGFMMPLEPDSRQKRFLLTSNPPSCFFHVPGGPAGAIEVFSERGVEATWEPIVLEGRFETVARSELGVIYRLHDARAVGP